MDMECLKNLKSIQLKDLMPILEKNQILFNTFVTEIKNKKIYCTLEYKIEFGENSIFMENKNHDRSVTVEERIDSNRFNEFIFYKDILNYNSIEFKEFLLGNFDYEKYNFRPFFKEYCRIKTKDNTVPIFLQCSFLMKDIYPLLKEHKSQIRKNTPGNNDKGKISILESALLFFGKLALNNDFSKIKEFFERDISGNVTLKYDELHDAIVNSREEYVGLESKKNLKCENKRKSPYPRGTGKRVIKKTYAEANNKNNFTATN